jgi:hypothetical protein
MRREVSLGDHLDDLLGHYGPDHTRCGIEVKDEGPIELLQDILEVGILEK